MNDLRTKATSTELTDRLLNRILGMTLLLINNLEDSTIEQQLETLQMIYESAQDLNDYLHS